MMARDCLQKVAYLLPSLQNDLGPLGVLILEALQRLVHDVAVKEITR